MSTVTDSEGGAHPARTPSEIVKIKLNHTPLGKENVQLSSHNNGMNFSGFLYIKLISTVWYEKNTPCVTYKESPF